MSKPYAPEHLDIRAFAQDEGELSGQSPLTAWPRVAAEAAGQAPVAPVAWEARGYRKAVVGGDDEVWLHLTASTTLPMICQRCLTPAQIEVEVDRSFRFVLDEATAMAQDDESEEDLLVVSAEFNLLELVEDELLMALPVVPRHESCPVAVKLAVADEDFAQAQAAVANPFAVLRKLREPSGD